MSNAYASDLATDVEEVGALLCTVLREAHERQIEETMDFLEKGPEDFYKSYLDR